MKHQSPDIDTDAVNIKSVSVWWRFYVLSYIHPSNIWSSTHEKAKHQWGYGEKKRVYSFARATSKKCCFSEHPIFSSWPCFHSLWARSVVIAGLELGDQRFPVPRAQLLTMCRGAHPAVIVRLRCKCLWSEWKW